MILPASYQSGFAPRDGRPLYPSLWKGCVGAWAPCLGPSGLTLRDWSGYGNHGTLTNMDAGSDWVTSGGKYALDFDGTNDYVDTVDNNNVDGTAQASVFAWIYQPSLALNKGIVGKWDYATQGTFAFQTGQGSSSELSVFVATSLTDSGTGCRVDSTNAALSANTWHHVGFVFDGGLTGNAARLKLYVNGRSCSVLQVAGNVPAAFTAGGTATLKVGMFGTGLTRHFLGQIDDVRVYIRALTESQVRVLASRRGIAYEIDFRRRNSEYVPAAHNRRRRLLIGASS